MSAVVKQADPTMILPPTERSTGTVYGGFSYSRDDRIPNRLPTPGDGSDRARQEPRTVGWEIGRYNADGSWSHTCGGRHLFDVIESKVDHVSYGEDDAEVVETDFRARLTCVRCGVVLAWEGRRTLEEHIATLAPAPLVVGDLFAQMVHSSHSGYRDWSRYDIFRRAGDEMTKVGELTPGSGQRGRAFVIGQLDAWGTGPGTYVEGKDPISALRAVARRARLETGAAAS